MSDEKQAAIDLCALLRDSIKEAVEASLENKIVDKLRLNNHLECKKNFNIRILEDLMMKGDSSFYRTYIYDIPGCYRYWIKHYIDDYVSNSPTVITNLAQEQLLKITKKVTDTISIICMKVEITKLESWLSIFTENLQGTLLLPRIKVNAFVGSCEVKSFSKYIHEEFNQIKLNLEAKFNNAKLIINAMSNRRNSPENLLYDKLIGCSATCPFCKEKCDKDMNHLGDHSMTLHRPECLGGYKFTGSNKLSFKTCTQSIKSQETFECHETGYREVKCSEYKTYFPNWYIPKLACGNPKYWKWFVCQYKEDVITWAGASKTNIPPCWFRITQKDAIDSLRSIYVQ